MFLSDILSFRHHNIILIEEHGIDSPLITPLLNIQVRITPVGKSFLKNLGFRSLRVVGKVLLCDCMRHVAGCETHSDLDCVSNLRGNVSGEERLEGGRVSRREKDDIDSDISAVIKLSAADREYGRGYL